MSADCGCGGTSLAVAGAAGCACGCEAPATGDGFVRPQFFGGMLLTEDDLQAAVDYAAAKRRLTNRHVIGAGVVCGLDVTCHPCDTGKVNVSPGYAIECCGNDIVVGCPEEVDVLALARDLRIRRGIDCGTPCDNQPQQDYYLYVRYTETPTEPVAPYATDDCVSGECEFSRVREGYCFELRCDPPEVPLSVIDALEACDPTAEVTDQTTQLIDVVSLAQERAAEPEPGSESTDRVARVVIASDDVEEGDEADVAPEGTTEAAEAERVTRERTFVAGARLIRQRLMRDLARLGQTSCADFRKISGLRFDALTPDSEKDTKELAEAYMRLVSACTCSAFHPPCPDCTDDAVVLAKVRVDGCDVTDVCALERRWVLSPRALGYWFPVVEMFRDVLEQVCCADKTIDEAAYAILSRVRTSGERATSAMTVAGGISPEMSRLRAMLGKPDAQPASAAPPDNARLNALEVRIEELGNRVEELADGPVPQ